MKPYFVMILLSITSGCDTYSNRLAAPMNTVPVIDPENQESIERWESSPYNYDKSKISVVKLRFLHGSLGDSRHDESKSVAIEVVGARANGVTPDQQSAIELLVQDEAAIYSEIRKAIYAYYDESYSTYREGWTMGVAMFGGDPNMIEDVLPEVTEGNELDDLVLFGAIFVHPTSNAATPIGITFEVPWDEEHGIGLRLVDGSVEKVGIAHDAYPTPQL